MALCNLAQHDHLGRGTEAESVTRAAWLISASQLTGLADQEQPAPADLAASL